MTEETLFAAALEKASGPERNAFLDSACGGDQQLRERIEKLLAADEHSRGILDQGVSGEDTGGSPAGGPDSFSGALIGPYKLIEQIGEGGMGTVWMAQQTAPVKRLVAIKLIKAGMDSKQVIARFEAERQALALMDHPNIARVLDGGTTDTGRPYFVMDLVKGVPITKYCDEHHLTPRQRLELFVPVCLAVQHAHQKGIIHRDLKPSNVLVAQYDGKPVPKVIDFGVAKAAGQSLTDKTLVTGFGAIVGTLEYMSPEQAEVNQLDIDTRSDIYSLGVLLYELLAGSPPFSKKDLEKAGMLEMLQVIREQEPSKPSTKLNSAEGLPALAANRGTEPAKLTRLVRGELDWIVMKALEKDRNRRYETANGFAIDIQRYLADEPVLACPPSAAYRLKKLVRRNRGPVLAAALVFLALVGGIIGTTWGMLLATDEANQKKTALDAAEASERDAKEQLREALWSQARASRFSRRPGQRLESLEALSKAAKLRPDDRLRDEAIAAMGLPDVRRVPGWRSSPLGGAEVAYSSNYNLYARVDQPGVISVRSIPDDREILRIQSGNILGSYLYFSPDDRHLLALEGEYELRVWRLDDGRQVPLPALGVCRAHAFSPDGKQLLAGQTDSLVLIDLTNGKELKRWRIASQAHTLAFHPNRREVAVGYLEHRFVSVYDVDSGALRADLPVDRLRGHVVAWHPHGDRLAITGSNPHIQIWDVPTRRKVVTLEGHVKFVPTLTFHPDGQLLATHGWEGMLLLWDPYSGRLLTRMTSIGTPHFSADGRWLGVEWSGDRAEMLEVTSSREYRTIVQSGSSLEGFVGGDISTDGRLLVMGMDDGARLWDLHSGRQIAILPESTSYAFFELTRPADTAGTKSPGYGLLTGGEGGLQRWPIACEDSAGQSLRLGPPHPLSRLNRAWFTRSMDGRTLAVATSEGIANEILDLETGKIRRLPRHPKGEVKALSGDGQWAASCGWHSDTVRLWNVDTGELAHEWILGNRTFAFFTPDSRTLVISRVDELSFWDVSTFQRTRRLPREVAQFPSYVAFSADGRLMAVEMAPAVIHLKEIATGRTVAQIEDPHGDRADWIGFTPDGTQMIVAANQARVIRVWDLRAVRTRLKAMNLDWDWPEFEPQNDVPPGPQIGPPPVNVVVDAGSIVAWINLRDRGETSLQARKWDEAIDYFTKAIDLRPDIASGWNGRGIAKSSLNLPKEALADFIKATELDPKQAPYWYRRAETQMQLNELREAIIDYSKAIDRSPEYARYWRARGIAHGRLSQWDQALTDLTRSTELNPKDPMNWSSRGDAYARVGELQKAIDDYSRSIDVAPNPAYYRRLRAAAHGRLGQWDKALTDYTKAVELRPAMPEYRCNQGFALAQLGEWEKAIESIKEATRLAQTYLPASHYLALLELRRGNVDEYRTVCSQIIARFETKSNSEEAFWIATTCALAPNAVSDWTGIVKFAENALAADPKSGDRINILGAVLFRAGRFKDAAERFAEAHKTLKENPGAQFSIIYNLLFRAMVQQRLDNSVEAATWLEKAVKEMSLPAATNLNDWSQSLTLQLLRREAEMIVGEKRQ